MTDIDLSAIREGDEVRLKHGRNLIDVVAHDEDGVTLYAIAYGTRIYFAQRIRSGWQRVSEITVVAHQPGLFE